MGGAEGYYDEVRAAGLFIERKDSTSPDRYPSLVTASRDPAARSRKPESTPPPSPPAPSPAPAPSLTSVPKDADSPQP